MGKLAKEHRKKVIKRKEAIKAEQKKQQKLQTQFLTQLIEREKASL